MWYVVLFSHELIHVFIGIPVFYIYFSFCQKNSHKVHFYVSPGHQSKSNAYSVFSSTSCLSLLRAMVHVQRNAHSVFYCHGFCVDFLRPSQKNQLWVFLGWTSAKHRIKYLAQGHNIVPPVKLEQSNPSISSQALYHWATSLFYCHGHSNFDDNIFNVFIIYPWISTWDVCSYRMEVEKV